MQFTLMNFGMALVHNREDGQWCHLVSSYLYAQLGQRHDLNKTEETKTKTNIAWKLMTLETIMNKNYNRTLLD